ncbi:hypothetical protein AAFF_G00178670 [Aldrovandia affinis]|uniref:Uncharacterized protein n=1 Tax=Aldrovandia affinis TaxID=143900 RepID=A0AAD7W761_9TELE|nr:hypothetical protein AAFF_G00178670 [Aldrovandia affinis]
MIQRTPIDGSSCSARYLFVHVEKRTGGARKGDKQSESRTKDDEERKKATWTDVSDDDETAGLEMHAVLTGMTYGSLGRGGPGRGPECLPAAQSSPSSASSVSLWTTTRVTDMSGCCSLASFIAWANACTPGSQPRPPDKEETTGLAQTNR